jgi:iron(III)-enterobactin esterase
MRFAGLRSTVVITLALVVGACSSGMSAGNPGQSRGSGGDSGAGGATSGSVGRGGDGGSGGTAIASGGVTASGTGNVVGTGGVSTGGAGAAVAATGGAGSPGGGSSSGGVPGTGGMVSGTGGTAGATAGRNGSDAGGGSTGNGGQSPSDPGTVGDGDSMVGPKYTTQTELMDHGNPKGKTFQFTMPLTQSGFYTGKDTALDSSKPAITTRQISVYVPAKYQDGTPAPLLILHDGPPAGTSPGFGVDEFPQVCNALDNLTIDPDPARRLPPFVVVAEQAGGYTDIGSERGIEYDTMSDKFARFIDTEVLPAVLANSSVKAAYPNLTFTKNPSGRATIGCSAGGEVSFTMGWFRPDLFGRVIGYSTTLVSMQNPKLPEAATYPEGAWDYHSDKQLIQNDTMGRDKKLRIFINVNENDIGSTRAESTKQNWVLANQRTAAALKARGFHYKFVYGLGESHCSPSVRNATLADALMWVWRGYQPGE